MEVEVSINTYPVAEKTYNPDAIIPTLPRKTRHSYRQLLY
jgi:hypothetical protein